jgi:chromosome segregation ATPase
MSKAAAPDLPSAADLKARVVARLSGKSLAALERAAELKKGSLSRILGGRQKLKPEHIEAMAQGLSALGTPTELSDLMEGGSAPADAPAPQPEKKKKAAGKTKKAAKKAAKKAEAKTKAPARTKKASEGADDVKSLKKDIAQLEKELGNAAKQIAEWEKKAAQWDTEKDRGKKREQDLSEEAETHRKASERLRGELSTMGQALAAAHEDQKGLVDALEEARQARSAMESELSGLKSQGAENDKAVKAMAGERDAALERLNKEKTASTSAWKHISELEEEVSEGADALKAERKKAAQLQKDFDKASSDREKLKGQVQKLSDALRQLKTTAKALRDKNVELRKRLEQGSRDDVARKERFELEKRLAEKGAALEAAREVIAQWRNYAKQRDLRVSQLKAALKKIQRRGGAPSAKN